MTEQQVVPMIHVPDAEVRATVDWYQSIGFAVLNTFEDDGEMNFALLAYGNSQIMITGGGQPSAGDRREVDLYVHTDDVERRFADLKDRVEIRLGLNNTFYGTREFTIRDPNRYWLTFGQDVAEA
jgi:uncharacterized glyoxalase superfamily protein PhnB